MKLKGSYTVEATLLMMIVIPLLFAFLYLGYYLHDRAVLENTAYELAVYAGLQKEKEDGEALIETKRKELEKGYLPGIKGIQSEMIIGSKKVSTIFKGTFQIPGMLTIFFGNIQLELIGKSELELSEPTKTISRLRIYEKWKEGE